MNYRLIYLTPLGHLADSVAFEAANDEQAIQKAGELRDLERDMELWAGEKRLKRFAPEPCE